MMPFNHKEAMKPLLDAIAHKDYDLAASFSGGILSGPDLQAVIDDYEDATSKNISVPTDEAYSKPYGYFKNHENGIERIFIVFHLWFNHEESDLCVELHLDEKSNGEITTHLEDIRVM